MAVTRLPLTASMVEHDVSIRRAALAGMIGAPLFGLIVAGLTVLQYDFMVGLGWHPVLSSTIVWPSGLAVGPYGWLQTVNFMVFGLALLVFARGLHQGIAGGAGSKVGPALLTAAGVGTLLCAFTAEPDLTALPQTVHGWLTWRGSSSSAGRCCPRSSCSGGGCGGTPTGVAMIGTRSSAASRRCWGGAARSCCRRRRWPSTSF